MKIVITGFMGCGKTRIARELARRLNLTMVDLDERITEKEGRSPAQLIVNLGEPVFRMMESDALREVLETDEAQVIALGGGAWIQETNRELVGQYGCLSVWLDVPFAMCWARIETSVEDRPLARTRNQALALYKRRRPIYQLAEMHIRADEVIEDLLQKVRDHFS
jgi:shikimate kinase